MNRPMRPFSKRVTTFCFEAEEESLTSGILARLMKQEEGGAEDEGGGREATML